MLASQLLPLVQVYWPFILCFSVVGFLLNNKFYKGLNKYPGPALAAYTNWWRFFENFSRRTEQTHIELHRKHGDIVRIGPNVLSIADPKAIKTIYGLNKGMVKSDFYPVQQAVAKGRRLESLFSTCNEDYHAKYRRCVSNAFAMSSLVNYEPLVDSTTAVYIQKTKEYFVDNAQRCSLNHWLQFFAFDVIGELTWSKRLGFIEKNQDVGGVIAFLNSFLSYASVVGQMPFLDLLWNKNPISLALERWGLTSQVFPVTKFALDRSASRADEMAKIIATGEVPTVIGRGTDLLSKFTLARHDHPEFMTDDQVLASCTSMVFAGSETTAISLSSIFYHLLKHPRAMAALMAELDAAAASGAIDASRPHKQVSWAEAQALPYLDAVIQESFRLHPAAGLILERVVPPQGITLHLPGTPGGGPLRHIPAGVIVGCNAWVLHRRPEVFGQQHDVDEFRPERWLEAAADPDPARLRDMKAAMFQFGAGPRTCIGKNISLLEIYKLVPTLLRNFEIELDCPDWKTHNAWFVRQVDFWTRFKLRETSEKAQ